MVLTIVLISANTILEKPEILRLYNYKLLNSQDNDDFWPSLSPIYFNKDIGSNSWQIQFYRYNCIIIFLEGNLDFA